MSVTTPTLPPARWWHALDDRQVVCTLCPRQCLIPAGGRGFCFGRANVAGRLVPTTYGRSSGFAIDPVEKKPLNHFFPGTPILSFGTAGCNLGCKFCQNWDISKSREMEKLAQLALPDAIVEAALKSGCRSLAFTYNDPVIWAEYALDIAQVAHGLKTVAVTAGYISREARGEFYQHMDAANVDLKAFTDGFYRKLCQAQLEPILDTLKFLKHQTQVWFELTNLIIPGENDSTEETKAMCGWIVDHLGPDVPVHFSAFHPDFKMRDTPPTPPETLVRARQIALAAGIRYAFVGNVNDQAHQSTYCHACGKLLIARDWYQLGAYHLRGNACGFCGAIIPGVFDDAGPGSWGRKRQAIALEDAAPAPAPAPALTARPAPAPPALTPKVVFTPAQENQILASARAAVLAALRNEPLSAPLPEPLAQAPAFGLFVSLHRAAQLRSCKGRFGNSASAGLAPLNQILEAVARDSATNDPRFPRITLEEAPFLTVEVSLMHSPQLVSARGEDRLRSVQVGIHGLVIMHPQGQGLLLPHVATEAHWDARTFLEQTCHKAGLPPQTWRDDQARLMTFRALKITSPPPAEELQPAELGLAGLSEIFAAVHRFLTGTAATAGSPGAPAQPQSPLLQRIHPEELGLCLLTASGLKGAAFAPNSSLLGLAQSAAQSLADALAQRGLAEPVHTMTLLCQPLTLAAADYPSRHQLLAHSAVLARADGRWSLVVPRADGRSDPVAEALAALQVTPRQWLADPAGRIRLTAFSILNCHNPRAPARIAPNPPGPVRPAFRAGMFYPADAAQARAEVDACLRAGGLGRTPPQPCRAIMLPHAGWRFCGGTMGKTLAGLKLPPIAIILGPKHTPLGPPLSVANHAAWHIPGAAIPVAVPLVHRLRRAIPQLACEPEAHLQEHAVEVLLPFLLRLRPDLQIVPLALGACPLDTLADLARELAAILRDAQAQGQEAPLLVISSDMNHFAPEPENRRRDMLALDAMQAGDPRRLYETCLHNDISMCGLLPAVTVMQALQHATPALHPRLIDYSNSAAASGDSARVVGYAGVVIA